MYNTVVTLELPRQCSWLRWTLLAPFLRAVRHGSPFGVLEGRYKNTCCNYGKIRSYAAANTFYPSKKISSSLLSTPNFFNRLKGHFRLMYLEKITKIDQISIYWSQFRYIAMALWSSTSVSRVFIEGMHLIDSPPYDCTQFRIPSFAEINLFFLITSTDYYLSIIVRFNFR